MGGAMDAKIMSSEIASPIPSIPVGENKIVSNVSITYEVK
jgi:hypothetical protein